MKNKLSKEQIIILEDLKSFIEFGIKHEMNYWTILSNIGHDISGLMQFNDIKKDGFLPRTSGYSKEK
jgi:hypothetical protein